MTTAKAMHRFYPLAILLAALALLSACRSRTETRVYIYQPTGNIEISAELLLEKSITPTLQGSLK